MSYRRIQVLLEPEQDDELERRALASGRSKSDLVREAVRTVWAPEEWPPKDDPFLMLEPAEGPDDGEHISRNVKRYLYGELLTP